MNYERLEDIVSRLRVVNSEIREIRREISVISDRIRDINRDIRRYTSLYQETMREMYRLYGRISWLERRGLYAEAKKLRAEAEVLYAEARGYRLIYERLIERRKELYRRLGRLSARLRVLRREKRELEKELYEITKKYPFANILVGVYAKYPHRSGNRRGRRRIRRRLLPSERYETWEMWVETSIPTQVLRRMIEDEEARRKIEDVLYAFLYEVLGEHLPEILSYNVEFADSLISSARRRGIDIQKLMEYEKIPKLFVEVLERKYRPPEVPKEVEWDNERLVRILREMGIL